MAWRAVLTRRVPRHGRGLPTQQQQQQHQRSSSSSVLSSVAAWVDETIWQRPNPLLTYVARSTLPDNATTKEALPPWDRFRPYHAPAAMQHILAEYQRDLAVDLSSEPSARIHQVRDAQRAPRVLAQCFQVLTLAGEPRDVHVQWQSVQRTWQAQQGVVWQALVVDAAVHEEEEEDDDAETGTPALDNSEGVATTVSSQQSVRYWQDQTGAGLDTQQRQERSQWQSALRKIQETWMEEIHSVQQSRTWLPLLYSHLGCRQALAREISGRPNAAVHALAHRHATPAHVTDLLAAVRENVVPRLRTRAHAAVSSTTTTETLSSSLLTKKNVTLEAAVLVLEQLCRDVFDLQLEWASPAQAPGVWLPDVRVLHLYRVSDDDKTDDSVYMGTCYFDFFARPGKAAVSCEIPVAPGVSVVSLPFQAPVWDSDPVLLSWLDLLEFFHEMGHVLQHHCSSGGSDPSWPVDWAEVLPKFMEHWLWEESTMKGLLMASGVDTDEEMLEVLYQQASRDKAADLAHQAFYGATEWELFSSYSIERCEETVMAVAQRLAEEYIPHNVPHSTDFSALFNIAQDNIHGENVALYRYLWAEAVSAHVFEKTKAAYQSPEGIPKEVLLQQLCQPGSWAELANAFDLPPDKIDMDPVWKRYRLE